MSWTQKEIQETMELCKSKAMSDNEFRLKLLNDPAAAIKELTGKEIPQGVKLQVLEQDPSADMTFVLPPPSSSELSDDELGMVSAAKSECDSQSQRRVQFSAHHGTSRH